MNQLTVIEKENQRVMTTAVLAEEYGTTKDVISKNFTRNKDRYTEGKHFYCLEGDELREFKTTNGQIDDSLLRVNKLYLWTEKGALLHAKSLGTDRAWEVYEILVDTYFTKQVDFLQGVTPELKAIIMQDKKLQAVENKVEQVNKDLQDFKLDLPLLGVELSKITLAVRRKGIECLGGKNSIAYKDNSLRGRVYKDIHKELQRQFGTDTFKAIKRNQCELAISVVNAYRLPMVLQKEIYETNCQIAI
jgi:hypothetical protein